MPNEYPYYRSSFEQSMDYLQRREWERQQAEREIERMMRQILSAAGYSPEYIEHMLTLPTYSGAGEQDRVLGLHGIEVKRDDDDEWEATIR